MSKRLHIPKPNGKPSALLSPVTSTHHKKIIEVDYPKRKPSVSLKYIDLNYCSFNDLRENHNLKHFDSFLNKLNKTSNWEDVFREFQRASSDDDDSIRKMRSLGFDPDQIEMFHLRVTQRFRVHGFLIEDRFKLVWLDPNHDIHKM